MTTPDFLKKSYHYDLPQELIAERPLPNRHESKLLIYKAKSQQVLHEQFKHIANYLPENATIAFNQSKVFPCRLVGQKSSGGVAEIFILSLLAKDQLYPCMIGCSGKKQVGQVFYFDGLEASIAAVAEQGTFLVRFNLSKHLLLDFLQTKAQIPIPPYIRGGVADEQDKVDYQTTYAKDVGSVAAPTAGLHFTQHVFDELKKKEIETAFVTLHVGAGTFQPVKADNILEHHMHKEFFTVDNENLAKLNQAKYLFAVGTTTLRVLESIYRDEQFILPESNGDMNSTQIFLHPGVDVKSIDGLITNFHLPESSLIMLVSSLIGREKTLELYQVAIEHKYRFFSYGDAMLILRNA
jgi:S-adenosylmethionine:tRNA ribosyltransferase-isomerase